MSNTLKGVGGILIVVAIIVVGWAVLTMPDQRSTGQKIGDAVDALPKGVDKAGRELESRTPGERFGDAVKDTGDGIKNKTSR